MVSAPKSGNPVFGHTEVNSGSSTTISYPGNWFGQVSMSGNLKSSPEAACSGVYRGDVGMGVLYRLVSRTRTRLEERAAQTSAAELLLPASKEIPSRRPTAEPSVPSGW